MGIIKYYEDVDDKTLLAHERESEFFVMFNAKRGEWVDSAISFSAFMHERYFREVTEEEARRVTEGVMPDAAYKAYIDMLAHNSGN